MPPVPCFINIFGGILRGDVLAQGIAAVKELGVPVPIVIRMKGTNVDEGKRPGRKRPGFHHRRDDGRSRRQGWLRW